MRPLELLKVIFGALSRDDLDALMLANASFRDIVLRDFAKEPFRYVSTLCIHEYKRYGFVITKGNEYRFWDNDDFSRRMRLARDGSLELKIDLNETLFDILLPHKDAWRDGYVLSPYAFASQSLFQRAFSELLFCKSIYVNTKVDGQLRQPFLSLPAVRQCTSLALLRPPRPLAATEILEWLNVDARSNEPKRLVVEDDALSDSVDNLVQRLKTDFAEAKKSRRYVVKVYIDAYGGESERIANKETSEMLLIRRGTHGMSYVEVERLSTAEKK